MNLKDKCFIEFKSSLEGIKLPKKFTFPFYYEPHELSKIASAELQEYLENQTDFTHNFGLNPMQEGLVIGKMFGVLVVQNKEGQLGYLTAFSGKLAESNHVSFFVPPVFDLLTQDGFFRKEEEVLNEINREIKVLEEIDAFRIAYTAWQNKIHKFETNLSQIKAEIKANKEKRNQLRLENPNDIVLMETLKKESIKEQYYLKDFTKKYKAEIDLLEEEKNKYVFKINELKEKRKVKSAHLQKEIFTKYTFLNYKRENKSLNLIFENSFEGKPPAGAGECAAPKLLQHAFLMDYQPLAMAEFWWGTSPKSELRIHKNFYPACKGKCEPILNHMLQGLELEENPFIQTENKSLEIPILFEDEYLLLVNKPPEFLSVPGKLIDDSIQTRIQALYPNNQIVLVHRLDMSTSGIILIAKSKEIYKKLQNQFIKRVVKKKYVALLDGILTEKKGEINLPLRLDIEDRPRQLVCFEHGKHALTEWELIEVKHGKTKVAFYPITGRTHQLRVHAAHSLGLNTPILGDDLYGNKSERLYLHAEELVFFHPVSNVKICVKADAEF